MQACADVALAYAKALKASRPHDHMPSSFDQRWSAWGSAFGGTSFTDGNAGSAPTMHGQRLWLCRRHGLSRHAEHHLRLRPDRRRHQLESGASAGSGRATHSGGRLFQKPLGTASISPARSPSPITGSPPTGSRLAMSCVRSSRGRAMGRGSSPATAMPCRSLAPKHWRHRRRDALCRLAGAGLPHARYSETDLTGGGFGLSYSQ